MIDLALRDEFKGKRLRGTTVDFTNNKGDGALQQDSADFLRITYPSHDLLKTIEACEPGKSRPVALIASRGQGKSHLMAALYHLSNNNKAGGDWLNEWADRLGDPKIGKLQLREDVCVIAEAMHLQNYKHLWDVVFAKHPKGEVYRAIWEHEGDNKTDVPGYDLMVKMFTDQPAMLIFDEFQTWFEGLTNSAKHKRKTWAFNFIQILSEIAQQNPDLLTLAVSVRNGNSDAYQQVRRVNPVDVDFVGPYAKRDRRRLLLYRIFENRMQVHDNEIESLISQHVEEYFRLLKISEKDHAAKQLEFNESWPFAPHLMQLLDDQVLMATDAQKERDLIKILVDLFKNHKPKDTIITAANFSLTNDKSGVASLLDSVANQQHKDLREKAQRNLAAVLDAVPDASTAVPNAEEIISSLWLRSLSVEKMAGAESNDLQIDVTRGDKIDDNAFEVELANIVDNSFNIHQSGGRLVFKTEENARAKLLSFAKNDKLFMDGEHAGQDIEHLAKEVRSVIGDSVSEKYRVTVLKRKWNSDPWSEFDEKEHPKTWDDKRLNVVVVPGYPDKHNEALGKWLKNNLQDKRNTIRFLLPGKGTGDIYFDRELVVLARAIYLAAAWHKTDPKAGYGELARNFRKDELVPKLKGRFNRLALLTEWHYGEPSKCVFEIDSVNQQGDKIPDEIDRIIREEIFEPESFEEYVELLAESGESVGKLLKDLREPRPNSKPCIPWLGETEIKERLTKLCATGHIALDIRGTKQMQTKPGESFDDAWHRMKGTLGSGSHLDQTTIHKPDAVGVSGGKQAVKETGDDGFMNTGSGNGADSSTTSGDSAAGAEAGGSTGAATINPFASDPSVAAVTTSHSAPATSSLNLLGQVESWGVNAGTNVSNVKISVGKLTGAQLQHLIKFVIKEMPDASHYALELEKEDNS